MSPGSEGFFAPLPSKFCASLVEEAPYGVFLVQEWLIVCANRWVREFAGSTPGREQPFKVLALIHPDDQEAVLRQIQLALSGKEPPSILPVRLTGPDGGERLAELTTTAVEHDGRPSVQGVLLDVTARADAERNLQQNALRLDAANRLRGLFGDILSHDLMNPVWIAENYLRLVMDGEIPEAKRPFYEGLRNSIAKARGILSDARTYLKINDQLAEVGERLLVSPLVEEVAASLRPLGEEKGQQVHLDLSPTAAINGGPQFREIVWHLLSNAIKFGPRDSSIDVAVGDGPRVRLEVRDRGPGVPPADRERIFQRFENKDKGPIVGVGLGLAIVRQIVQQHDGRVWVEDNPGGGSVFIAEFPAVD